MSDFWEKNKGSITSGLKTAGKYGYQGTKYVAKSGYKASKNSGSRRKERERRKNKDGDEEEDEEEDDGKRNGHYNQQPPYGQYGGAQAYGPPQQQWQQPYQQPPQPYQPYPLQYQQPPPQYQQPPQQYQQPPQQYQPQPGQYQPSLQPYQQIPPQPQPSQACQQPYGQPYQAPQQYVNAPEAGQGYQTYPPQPVQQPQIVAPLQQQAQPGYMNQAPAASPRPLPTRPAAPNGQIFQPPAHPGTVQGERGSFSDQDTQNDALTVNTVQASGFNRARAASPPMAERSSNSLHPLSTGQTPPATTGSSIPPVIPYQKEIAEEKKLAERITIPQVDLTSLPPPPTRRDRGSETKTDSALSSSSLNNAAPSAPHQTPAAIAPTQSSPSEIAEPVSAKITPVSTATSGIGLEPAPRSISPVASRETNKEVSIDSKAVKEGKPVTGITGQFDYNIQVKYAPPPKPHRGPGSASSTFSHSTVTRHPSNPAPAKEESTSGRPPALPRRETSGSVTSSNTSKESFSSSFQPPPKPYRRTDQVSDKLPKPELSSTQTSEKISNDVSPAKRDISSFPPPPKPKRWDAPKVADSTEKNQFPADEATTSIPHARGRLQQIDPEPENLTSTSSNESYSTKPPSKKASPPIVKPKPKKLSTATFIHPPVALDKDEKTTSNEIGDITDELAQVKLRKTGSDILDSSRNDRPSTPRKVNISPSIPPKRDALKKAPPIPTKSQSLQFNPVIKKHDEEEMRQDSNPFSIYLKNAVPSESDRLHR